MFSSNTSAVSGDANYIEDVFSTYLYTGNSSTQTITNGIDVTGKGGLIWFKERAAQGFDHALVDTARGNLSSTEGYSLASNQAAAQSSVRAVPTSSGFSLSSGSGAGPVNFNGSTYASWTFRKQPKFFDVVTYTGNGTNRTIAHSLGSVPGCIIVKETSGTENWRVYHSATGNAQSLYLNTTDAALGTSVWNSTSPTSTNFTVSGSPAVNGSGSTYVAYLFAHNAGGFGLTGTDNVISCGSFTVDGSGNSSINLGYEPQWLLMKQTNTTGGWIMQDTMRGQTAYNGYSRLRADTSDAETSTTTGFIRINATGFSTNGATGLVGDHIYIAIRRGPMKTPTTGTSVFSPVDRSGTGSTTAITTPGFAPDALFSSRTRNSGGYYVYGTVDKLRGAFGLEMTDTVAENAFSANSDLTGWSNVGYGLGPNSGSNLNQSGLNYIDWVMQRAPGFFDVVCYTGTGASPRSINHNLGVAPQLWIVKSRTAGATFPEWWIGTSVLPLFTAQVDLNFDNTAAQTNNNVWNDTLPTSTVFYTGNALLANESGYNYVAYLFASCPGVSKVGSYTGTGTTLQVNCGFTGGARFVLIKRTDSTGDWYVWDSARGIVAGNDPYLRLNSRAAEVTTTDYIDTYSAGFEISSTAPAAINANGGSFVFLAIA